jgi:hypothetical protein
MMIKEGDLVICVGGGFFGAKAVKRVKEKGAKVVVIDSNAECTARELCDEEIEIRIKKDVLDIDIDTIIESLSWQTLLLVGDGIEVLKAILIKTVPKLIVPAIPGNLMGKLTKTWLKRGGITVKEDGSVLGEILEGIPRRLVLAGNKEEGVLISSYMPEGKMCKIECDEPKICPVTGVEKPAPMHAVLRFCVASGGLDSDVEYKYKYHCRILISRLIGGVGGAGGIAGTEVIDALKYFELAFSTNKEKDRKDILAVGTACSCHGILNLFSMQDEDEMRGFK